MDEFNASHSGFVALADAFGAGNFARGLRYDDCDMVLPHACASGGRHMEASGASQAVRDRQALERLLKAVDPSSAGISASNLLNIHGSLASVFAAFEALTTGDSISQLLHSVHNVIVQSLRSKAVSGPIVSTSQSLIDYLSFSMSHLKVEEVRVLFLNVGNRIINDQTISRGTINEAPIYPREIIRRALDCGSTALILAHNHPSGDPIPSAADVDATRRLILAGQELGIVLHDHIILAQGGWISLKSEGFL
jgi:DNA repair protein RadC